MDKIYTSEEVAQKLGSHKKTIEIKLRKGEIKGYKKLGKWYVLHSDLIEWIKTENK